MPDSLVDRGVRVALRRILDEPQSSRAATAVFVLIGLSILTAVATFYMSTVARLREDEEVVYVLKTLQFVCGCLFTAEISLRLLAGTLDFKRILCYDPFIVSDILSIVPFLIELGTRNGACDLDGVGRNSSGGAFVVCTTNQPPPAIEALQLLRLLRRMSRLERSLAAIRTMI